VRRRGTVEVDAPGTRMIRTTLTAVIVKRLRPRLAPGWLLALCLCAVPAVAQGRGSAPARRPNILIAISDDQSFPHAGAYGDPVVRTPNFDEVARRGVLFTHAFAAAPSCTPSRAAILTGQDVWRLREGGNLWGTLPVRFRTYPELLAEAGYVVGMTGKGWGPGREEPGGRTQNPAGPAYRDFESFFRSVPEGKPFAFWFGSHDPHRPYEAGSGAEAGLDPGRVRVPGYLPDAPEVRRDILDYYAEIERFDRGLGEVLRVLEAAGELENTIVVVTSDNGMPFPRAKATLYDAGTRVPLTVMWPAAIPGGRRVTDFVNLEDLAPTFLEAAGVAVPAEVTGRSLLPVLRSAKEGRVDPGRDLVVTARERHAWVRKDGVGYPARALRTGEYLYIVNFEPERWPAGDPDPRFSFSGNPNGMGAEPEGYGDVDPSPSKAFLLSHEREYPALFAAAFAKRPPEELYRLSSDPFELTNLADDPRYARVRTELRRKLAAQLAERGDPRVLGRPAEFDSYPYYGRKSPDAEAKEKAKQAH
jgi:uncharacterized sulfatase